MIPKNELGIIIIIIITIIIIVIISIVIIITLLLSLSLFFWLTKKIYNFTMIKYVSTVTS